MTSGWIVLLFTAINAAILNLAEAEVPAIFIFGDSTADVGTNNHLKSLAKADNPYNGIDYSFSKPTGRFSNGLNTVDFIVRLLGGGKKSRPPFLSLLKRPWSFKRNLLLGANFASGGSGIFKQTGKARFGEVISLGQQIQQFGTVRQTITETLDAVKADLILSKALHIISVGSNDLFDYQLSNSSIPPETLMNDLMDTYAIHLQNLYTLGARNFGIISVPPIGCCPAERVFSNTGGCIQEMNELALAFYTSTQDLLRKFSSEFQGVKYSLGNSYQMTMNIINNPLGNGLKDVKTACCGNGTLNGQSQCEKGVNLCSNRNDYLFWDRFHPTQAASQLAALTFLYAEGPEFVTPVNFSRLGLEDIKTACSGNGTFVQIAMTTCSGTGFIQLKLPSKAIKLLYTDGSKFVRPINIRRLARLDDLRLWTYESFFMATQLNSRSLVVGYMNHFPPFISVQSKVITHTTLLHISLYYGYPC